DRRRPGRRVRVANEGAARRPRRARPHSRCRRRPRPRGRHSHAGAGLRAVRLREARRPRVTITVGISIAIPEPHGEALRDKRRSYGDLMADRIPSHITLAPPLLIDEAAVDAFGEDLHELAEVFEPFTVSLSGTGTFRPISPVVFI